MRKQAIKQRDLAKEGINTPAILGRGYRGELFYFDMAYVPGIVAAQAMVGDKQGLDRLVAFYCQTVEKFGHGVTGRLSARLFEEKISSVASTRSALLAERQTAGRVARVGDWLAEADWRGIPKSLCHGDLTLENTIISRSGEFSLIDCLDGPLSTFWLDVAKLYQDFSAHWFLRGEPEVGINAPQRSYALLTAAYLGKSVRRRLEPTMPDLFARLKRLVGLQLFRLVPYCRRPAILHYTLDQLEILMNADLSH